MNWTFYNIQKQDKLSAFMASSENMRGILKQQTLKVWSSATEQGVV